MTHQSLMCVKFLSGRKVPQLRCKPGDTRAPYETPQLLLTHDFGAKY